MKAACLLDGTDTLQIVDLELDAPGPHEVILSTRAVGLCHSDLHVLDGSLTRPRPLVLGHEAAGVVVAVGSAVERLRPGMHVITCLVMGCGACRNCERGAPTLCLDSTATKRPGRLLLNGAPVGQMAGIGALAEMMLVDERAIVAIPDSMPFNTAALLGCAVVTGLGSVFNVAKVQPGDSVAVIGCGGIGLNLIQASRIAGAGRIAAIDVNDAKIDHARRLGATQGINSASGDITSLAGGGFDHVFEAVGRPSTVAQAIDLTEPGGTTNVVGVLPDGSEAVISAKALRSSKTVRGIFMGATQPRADVPRYIQFWERGQLDLDGMISTVLSLDEVNDGFAALARGEVARAVVSFPNPT
jgi:S-(hydroxymethyl)glutathione dehydrogenase / alcohol dehydrogenase